MASVHLKTPVHSHPLLPDEIPSRGRRTGSRPNTDSDPPRQTGNYFTLRAQLENDTKEAPNWDGSVRGYSKTEKQHRSAENNHSGSLTGMWERPTAPLFIVGSSRDSISPQHGSGYKNPELIVTSESDTNVFGPGPSITAQVLAISWHDYSDEAIHAAISNISVTESPAGVSSHPYYTAIRVLSSALHNLSRAREELEEQRRVLQEKEVTRRERADALMKELQSSDRDIAKRVIQSIFADADETRHRVHRQQSFAVCKLIILFSHSLILI